MLKVGDSVGAIYKVTRDGVESFELMESKITKIVENSKGRKYHTKAKFYPLDADDVDMNTELQENLKDCILTKEVFGLNDTTRVKAENWVKWANENMNDAIGVLSGI